MGWLFVLSLGLFIFGAFMVIRGNSPQEAYIGIAMSSIAIWMAAIATILAFVNLLATLS